MNRFLGVLIGSLIGLIPPMGWLFWQFISPRVSTWARFLKTEMGRNGEWIVVLGVFSATGFAFLGYLISRRMEDLEETSQSVQDSNFELSHMATTDGLTGLFNNRYIHDALKTHLENAHRTPLSCLLVDIDHFKKINDKYGHPFGDEVLVYIGKILKRSVRRIDPVGRLGGEEFLIILPDMPGVHATEIAERIRETIQNEALYSEERKVTVTVSIGVASSDNPDCQQKDALLQATDKALYKAKNGGRNRTETYLEN